jgi:hypothetical protein
VVWCGLSHLVLRDVQAGQVLHLAERLREHRQRHVRELVVRYVQVLFVSRQTPYTTKDKHAETSQRSIVRQDTHATHKHTHTQLCIHSYTHTTLFLSVFSP